MKMTFFNTNIENVDVLDILDSLLWVDKYDEFGEYELIASPSNDILSNLLTSAYIGIDYSEHLMLIEYINIKTDLVNGNKLILKGRSLESILNRRIIEEHTVIVGNLQDGILQLLNENAINPTDPDRKINLLEFVASTDPVITALTMENQFEGENLYDVISILCKINGIGFKIVVSDTGKFQFKLYSGKDRSYNQAVNSWVVFAPNFDNLVNADYVLNNQSLKTTVLVSGESGVGNIRTKVSVAGPNGAGTDLARREMYVDAKDVTRNGPDGTLTEQEYQDQLAQRGLEALVSNQTTQSFDGQLETDTNIYVLGIDFFMGDILQVANEYGHEGQSRVVEIIHFKDENGEKIYPTFASLSN